MCDQNILLVRHLYEKDHKIENVEQYILIDVQNCFWKTTFYLRNKFYLAKILRALLSNKNGILHYWKSQ